MSESNHETISLHAPRDPKSNGDRTVEPTSKLKMPRPSLVALFSILILFIGWGTWRYLGSMKLIDDSESVSELDGIEAVTPLFDPDAVGNTSLTGTDGPRPVSASKGLIRGISSHSMIAESPSTDGTVGRAEVWLTGTIEVDSDSERIEIPQRISGGPNESSSIR